MSLKTVQLSFTSSELCSSASVRCGYSQYGGRETGKVQNIRMFIYILFLNKNMGCI